MTYLEQAARQALDALENIGKHISKRECDEAIDALRAALAQQAEPVAWGLFSKHPVDNEWVLQHPVRFSKEDANSDRAMYEKTTVLDVRPLYASPQQQAEPVVDAVLAEREACAKVAQETVCDTHIPTGYEIYGTRVAAAIRARGQK